MSGETILLVDDEANIVQLARLYLQREGYTVIDEGDGLRAVERVNADHPALMVLDIMLPGMDGYEITRRIRAQLRFRKLPILALTAKAMKGDREKCLEAGANDYLSKPVDAERLLSMLRVWLSKE